MSIAYKVISFVYRLSTLKWSTYVEIILKMPFVHTQLLEIIHEEHYVHIELLQSVPILLWFVDIL